MRRCLLLLAVLVTVAGCSSFQSFRQSQRQEMATQYSDSSVRQSLEAREPD